MNWGAPIRSEVRGGPVAGKAAAVTVLELDHVPIVHQRVEPAVRAEVTCGGSKPTVCISAPLPTSPSPRFLPSDPAQRGPHSPVCGGLSTPIGCARTAVQHRQRCCCPVVVRSQLTRHSLQHNRQIGTPPNPPPCPHPPGHAIAWTVTPGARTRRPEPPPSAGASGPASSRHP